MSRITRLPPITFRSLKPTCEAFREPTPRQLEILAFVERFLVDNRIPPTIREMCIGLKLSPNAVMGHLKALKKKGAIQHVSPGRSRGYIPVVTAARCPLCGRPYPTKETSRE